MDDPIWAQDFTYWFNIGLCTVIAIAAIGDWIIWIIKKHDTRQQKGRFMDKEFFQVIGIFIGVSFLSIFLILFIAYGYRVNVSEANIVQISLEGKKIYEGKAAFVNVSTGGMTTTVAIYKSLFPIPVLDKYYSDKNIIVMPKE